MTLSDVTCVNAEMILSRAEAVDVSSVSGHPAGGEVDGVVELNDSQVSSLTDSLQ